MGDASSVLLTELMFVLKWSLDALYTDYWDVLVSFIV